MRVVSLEVQESVPATCFYLLVQSFLVVVLGRGETLGLIVIDHLCLY